MKVYFVRHGVSEMGEGIHQTPETRLSMLGQRQAENVAKRFKNIDIDLILTSTSARATATANEIRKIKDVTLLESELFVERKMPNLFLGKKVDDPEITPIHNEMRKNFDNDRWRFGEEENFHDLKRRVDQSLTFISSQKKENIAVVTHGYFLTFLIFEIIFEKSGEINDLRMFQKHTLIKNTGITVCEYQDNTWKLITWNDIVHMGE